MKSQRELLIAERAPIGQADQLDAEATSLIEEAEMGDVQFDDEGGEGDTMVVERERDLALSAQARNRSSRRRSARSHGGRHLRLLSFVDATDSSSSA